MRFLFGSFLVIVFFFDKGFAQSLIEGKDSDSISFYLYVEKGNLLQQTNPDSAAKIHEAARKTASVINKPLWLLRESEANRLLGHDYFLMGDYQTSLVFFTKAIEIAEKETKNKNATITKEAIALQARSIGNLGNVHYVQGNYSFALENFFKALKINERLKNKLGQAKMYGNIGLVYFNLGKLTKALDYTNRAMLINLELNNQEEYNTNLTNLGSIYWRMKNYPRALEYYSKSYEQNKESQDFWNMAVNLGNMGNVYVAMEEYKKAEECYQNALTLNKKTGNISGNAVIYGGLANVYINQKRFSLAEKYLTMAMELNKQLGTVYDEQSNHESLFKLYFLTGKYKEAIREQTEAVKLKDTIQSLGNRKALVQKEMQAQFEKRESLFKANQEKKEALSKKELEKQKILRNAFVVGFALMLILSLIIYRSFKLKQLANKIINEQKKEVEKQKQIIEEKHKEITDSINYAERIQKSFLASEAHLKKNTKDFFILYMPKDVVSGDFFWSATLNNQSFAFVTADSTGHGVPGAIMSLLNITSLEKAIETETEPHQILNVTRDIIINRLKKDGSKDGGKDGMDCSLCVYNFERKKLYMAAANNPVWIIRKNELIEIKPDKMPVGKHEKQEISFNVQEVNLEEGDLIYTLTDGFPDQFGGIKNKKFTTKRLKSIISDIHTLPMLEQKNKLKKIFENWIENKQEQIDDVTIVGMRVI